MKKIKYFLIAAILTVISFCFSPLTASADDDIRPQKLAISGTQKTVYTGSTFKVSAKYSPSNADDDHLYWAIVGTKGIVQFADDDRRDDDIKLKALKAGTTKLRCHIVGTNKLDYITITVKNRPSNKPQKLNITLTRKALYTGTTYTLKAAYSPSNANENYLNWAIVGTKGIIEFAETDVRDNDVKIRALKPGTTKVRCHIIGTNKLDYVTITVKNKPVPKPQNLNITLTRKALYTGTTYTLKATYSPSNANENYLNWAIVGTKGIIEFAETDVRDNDVKIRALKPGTTKVRCHIIGTSKLDYVTITVKNPPNNIAAVGSLTKIAELGDDFELEVKKRSGFNENYLRWTIRNTNIVRFDDDDRIDDEVEFKAIRTGTTTVTCTDLSTNKSITYTIRVVPERDDDYDEDDDDDDDD